ncbi:MAG: cardiolipin synthase [Clostridium perfringens]|uniref:Cardiolipin synthase n=1 Tax=Clostridium perfringens TaxID=1502 RepID=A0AAW4IYI4_CLOPF|nr:cardiolipin synthase [Clostridium perfringens]MBO3356407.1 cardiolipin synthase [Clostridium perfringens]MBO3359678.1 cardiolipin synthase [Clostridium perfringens]MDU2319591.1 cardiolipin synthase [Clostridium perfringens]MDU7981928.1 cardiolipin synthase [Clostridium perfringens]
MEKFLKKLLSRAFIVGFLIFIQFVILMGAIWKVSEDFIYVYFLFIFISIVVFVYIVSRKDNPSYKLAWAVPVLLVPVFGGLFYLIFGGNKTSKKFRKQIKASYDETAHLLYNDRKVLDELEEQDKSIANQSRYIADYSQFPVYKNTTTEYLSPGEVFFERLKEELKKAKHYIFMEYFIVHEGVMWDSILEILEEKVKEGVEVRFVYDDMGCLGTLPYKYNEVLEAKGIKCMVFNPFVPLLSLRMNNRDHRKITVIDGHTGGINLADEYINEIVRFGHWKDASIMLKGDAVWNLTVMFLQIWNFYSEGKEKYEKYYPYFHHEDEFESDGYVQPYGDSPLDDEIVGENVYLNIINKAKDYVYINTPYLIIDNELVTALTLAAKSGIDVRIVTPHIEDKWYAHIVTRAYYPQLIESGVKIYEYTPGFIHSKTFVSDDEIGIVGTINMDYRSLYLHFECGVWLYKTKSVGQIKDDFLKTLEKCQRITLEDCAKVKVPTRILRSIIRVFAPLM